MISIRSRTGIGQFSGGFIAGALGYGAMFFVVALFPLAACFTSLAVVKKGSGARR